MVAAPASTPDSDNVVSPQPSAQPNWQGIAGAKPEPGAPVPSHAETQAVPRFVYRVAAFIGGWTVLHSLILGAVLAPILPGGWWFVAAFAVVVFVPFFVILRGFKDGVYPGAFVRRFVYRPFWYAQLALPFLSVGVIVGLLVGLPFGAPLAVSRAAFSLVLTLLVVLGVAGYVGSRSVIVHEVEFAFTDLPDPFDGFRIAQMSDLHVGPQTSRRYLAKLVRLVERAHVDLVAHTGDQVDDFWQDVSLFNRAFAALHAPAGVVAIPGNHDVYAGWDEVRQGLEGAGIRVLVNESTPIERGGAQIWLVGTGDPAGEMRLFGAAPHAAPDIAKAMQNVPAGAFTIALAHNPDLWPQLAQRNVALTLSGHTHHGQVSIPRLNWSLASMFLEYPMGMFRANGAALYVNPGTGFWGLPLRLGAWPEITVIVLRKRLSTSA
ncbi:MAG: metallophosphoesterase [Thermoplasmatota archaeon]